MGLSITFCRINQNNFKGDMMPNLLKTKNLVTHSSENSCWFRRQLKMVLPNSLGLINYVGQHAWLSLWMRTTREGRYR
jgi:hypothetical protein